MQVKSWKSGRMMGAVIFLTLSAHKVIKPGGGDTIRSGLAGRKVSSQRSEQTNSDVWKDDASFIKNGLSHANDKHVDFKKRGKQII